MHNNFSHINVPNNAILYYLIDFFQFIYCSFLIVNTVLFRFLCIIVIKLFTLSVFFLIGKNMNINLEKFFVTKNIHSFKIYVNCFIETNNTFRNNLKKKVEALEEQLFI